VGFGASGDDQRYDQLLWAGSRVPKFTSARNTEIFDVVQSGEAGIGVVPFENSTFGIVKFTLDCLADRSNLYKNLLVCGEIYLDVHHYLLGHKAPNTLDDGATPGTRTPTADDPNPLKPRAKPLTSLKHIQRIYSHEQGFGQTTAFLSTYLRGVETQDVSSTSKAAELVRQDATGTSAAIASEIAAEMNGLDVLARKIEDRDDNTTRFFVIRRQSDDDAAVDEWVGPSSVRGLASSNGSKSLVSFTVSHTAPGALTAVLECFRQYQLNLTSINSMPSLIKPFQYLFLVEFEGSRLDDSDGRVGKALADVETAAQEWRWLGSWERQR
jgi:prephenate dehydratase